jgi:hypothetical protein
MNRQQPNSALNDDAAYPGRSHAEVGENNPKNFFPKYFPDESRTPARGLWLLRHAFPHDLRQTTGATNELQRTSAAHRL